MSESERINVKAVMEEIKRNVYGKDGTPRSSIPRSLYEGVRQISLLEKLDGDPPIMTHNPSLGWIVMPVKRLLGRLMKWYVRPLAEKITERNRIEAEAMQGLLREVERLEREVSARSSKIQGEGREMKPEPKRGGYPDWYFGLENRLRGPSERIAVECARYLGLFEGKTRVLDLGCGRGEFLEILHRKGIPAEGIDIDPDMVAVCREKGLDVEQGDLFERLSREPNGSLDGIFCSQVVEHLDPEEILDLVRLAFHRLSERGVLVIETLNPACLTIFSGAFYADPTHRAPVHPEVLRYFLERMGFAETDVWYGAEVPPEERLELLKEESESDGSLNRNFEKLNSVLYGFAHYAAVGRKS